MGGNAMGETDEKGRPVSGDTLLLLLHFDNQGTGRFLLPSYGGAKRWELLLDTKYPLQPPEEERFREPGMAYEMTPRSLALFRLDEVLDDD
jgi:hypothetical protein